MLVPWLGWIALIICFSELLTYFARKLRLEKLRHFRGKHHLSWGKGLLAVALLHGLLTGAFFTFNLGTLCYLGLLLIWAIYHWRQKLGKYWLNIHRPLSLAVILLGLVHALSKLK